MELPDRLKADWLLLKEHVAAIFREVAVKVKEVPKHLLQHVCLELRKKKAEKCVQPQACLQLRYLMAKPSRAVVLQPKRLAWPPACLLQLKLWDVQVEEVAPELPKAARDVQPELLLALKDLERPKLDCTV